MPTSVISSYGDIMGRIVPKSVRDFNDNPDSMSASALAGALDWIATKGSIFQAFREWKDCSQGSVISGTGEGSFYDYLYDEVSGERLHGLFRFSDHFASIMQLSNLAQPLVLSDKYWLVSSGSADTLQELANYVQVLTKRDDVRLSGNVGAVMRVEESNDFSLFRDLYPVGKWGDELRASSEYASLSHWGKTLVGGVVTESMSRELKVNLEKPFFLPEKKAYYQTYDNYESMHDSFLKFEVWVLL